MTTNQTNIDQVLMQQYAEEAAALAYTARSRVKSGQYDVTTLDIARQSAAELDWLIRGLVTEARRSGTPWHMIGKALNISTQGAQQRYGKADR